jgi:hypothetical protein
VLINRHVLNILSLENLGFPSWRLSVGWNGWLEVRWLEMAGERVPSKIRILPSQSTMVYGIVPLLFLLFFF